MMNHLARLALFATLLLACSAIGLAQAGGKPQTSPSPQASPQASPTPPEDRPFGTTADETQKLDEAIKPYVEKARKTYPDARQRFLAGLPPKHTFYVTTRIYDREGHFEQVFITVREIKDGVIKGIIASEVEFITGYKAGDSYSFPEAKLIDWTIVKPDGSEEGNFVGKFLDEYQKQQ